MPTSPPPSADGATVVPLRRRLGKYEILRHIATGGMAEIHLARATGIEGFEKLCVVKQILPNLAENREFVEMFLDEARLAATLHHSNVVQVYDIGSVDGVYFFAMEFLHGEDLGRIHKAVLARGEPVPLDHAVNVAIGACAGLHYAHEKVGLDGRPLCIVHRDVSPANVFVTFDGGIKLLDFGIAKASLRHTETRAGTLKGKIRYMSPEQCRGDRVDRRSDVFSLCIMLWELTTGRRVFDGQNDFDLLEAIVHRNAPAPSQVCDGYPPELERILMRGLQRNPAARYQTAEDLQIDLEAFARENKLVISSVALSRWVKGLFAEKLAAWQRAQQEGMAFADYLADAYAHGHEQSASGRRDPASARRTRTETSGAPLPASTQAEWPPGPTVAEPEPAAAGEWPPGPTVAEPEPAAAGEWPPGPTAATRPPSVSGARPAPARAAAAPSLLDMMVSAGSGPTRATPTDDFDIDEEEPGAAEAYEASPTTASAVPAARPGRLRWGVIVLVALALLVPAVGIVVVAGRDRAAPAPRAPDPGPQPVTLPAPAPRAPPQAEPSTQPQPSAVPTPTPAPGAPPEPQAQPEPQAEPERPPEPQPPGAQRQPAPRPAPAARAPRHAAKPRPTAAPPKARPKPAPKPKPRRPGPALEPLLPP